MCGLVGVMGDIGRDERAVLYDLLVVDTLRGKHSTGVACIDRQGEAEVVKRAVNAIEFLDFKSVSTVITAPNNCIIGHNRYATKGAINSINAHPFDFSNVVGAHNGTLSYYWELDDYHKYEVDSECLYSHINTHGIDDAYEKVEGAMALTWFDKETNKLHLFRNSERPLCYAFSEDQTTLFWASEGWMLSSILWRQGIKHGKIIYLNEDTLYSFVVPKGIMTKGQVLQAPSTRKLAAKKKNPTHGGTITSVGGSTTTKHTWKDFSKYLDKTVEITLGGKCFDSSKKVYLSCYILDDPTKEVRIYTNNSKLFKEVFTSDCTFSAKINALKSAGNNEYFLITDNSSIVAIQDDLDDGDSITVEGYDGERLNFKQFKQATSEGCSWCKGAATFGKPTKFINTFDFFCHHCLQDGEVKDYILEM